MKQGASDEEIQDIVVSVEDLCLKIIAIGEVNHKESKLTS